METREFILILISAISTAIVGVYFYIKLYLSEKIKNSIKHEYDGKLEVLKSEFNRNNSVLSSVLNSQNQGLQNGHNERIDAIKIYWTNYMIVRQSLSEIVLYDGVLTENEFNSLYTVTWQGNDVIEKTFNNIPYDRLTAINEAQKAVEKVRPFLNEKLWLLFMFSDIFSGRILYLYKEGTKTRQIKHWKSDSALINMAEKNLTSEEFAEIKNLNMGTVTAVQNFIEQKILSEMSEILTGKHAATETLKQALKLNELVDFSLQERVKKNLSV